jgi:hypothetical protein
MKRLALCLVVALTSLVATPSIVLAANAVVTRDADVYRRLDSNSVVNDVEEDQLVTVTECRRGDRGRRCFIEIPGRDGWVDQRRVEPYDEDTGESGGSITFDFGGVGVTIGEDGAGVSIGGGTGSSGPSSGARACFFEHADYNGRSFCVRRGDNVPNVGYGWNDRISSIRLYGGARAEACTDDQYNGSCQSYDSNASSIGSYNDTYSSVRVY